MSEPLRQKNQVSQVVIVGAGFAGLYAAKCLAKNSDFHITLIDKRNYHLFQPLLYQVATGQLSPGDIAAPIRFILRDYPNVRVIQATVTDLDPTKRQLFYAGGQLHYDILIAATGVKHSYFGNDQWRAHAPGLKTVEHALEMRQRIFSAFEAAELEQDPQKRQALMNFVVVGAGPTGVELAGALGELAHHALCKEFRAIDSRHARIILAEGAHQILPSYPTDLALAAQKSLQKLGVEVCTGTKVTQISDDSVRLENANGITDLPAATVLWAAGIQASRFGRALADRTQAKLDRTGKVIVNADMSVPGQPEIFVIGDLANYAHQGDKPLPGVAQVAIQQGTYVADLLRARKTGKSIRPFQYHDKGSLAVIGRNAAVADLGRLHLTGVVAWYLWALVHVWSLIEFGNRVLVMTRWAWSYLTRQNGVRLITSIPGARTVQADRAHHRPDKEKTKD